MENTDTKSYEELVLEVEALKNENDTLNSKIQTINESVKSLAGLLLTTKEYNVKLGYSTRLFAETYLTNDEKKTIAKEFDMASSAEQVEKIYNKYYSQMAPEGAEINPDFLWSREFTRDIEKFYFYHKGFNPFELINEAIKAIRLQFKIEDDLRNSENPDELNRLKEAWQANRPSALESVTEILSITNEILRK